MPLKKNDHWLVDIRPDGRAGKRIRKKFNSKAEALRFEISIQQKANEGKDWNPNSADKRPLSELIDIWFNSHGRTLRDSTRLYNSLKRMNVALGQPIAQKLTPQQFLAYRTKRLDQGISPKTLNNEYGYISAVYNELERTEIIDYLNPLRKIKPIKIQERELSYLSKEQIKSLLSHIENTCENPHVLLISKICLSTGARWGEAENLESKHIKNNRITYTDTKSGKNRTIPITQELYNEIKAHGTGKLFTSRSSASFWRALQSSDINLPKGQATHVLRHTYASHFIMNGGNILTLQKILGHSSVTITMRYAHLSPDHLADAVTFNPLSNI